MTHLPIREAAVRQTDTPQRLVTCASTSGLDALGYLSRKAPKLVILDVMMPDMDGIDTLRAIRRNTAFDEVAVMMYTADASYNRWREAIRDGAQAYDVKGTVNWDDLVKEVKRFV